MGVLAHYWTCGDDCADMQLGWFEKYTVEAVAVIEGKSADPTYDIRNGRLISMDGKDWVVASSQEGTAITRSFYRKCPGKFRQCYPSNEK